ncbi:hypothetical protein GUJ93_ZPchr0011g26967 [Zizania palustris]|uniref:Knottin scorpion toxin-like domain-containing protein n=1 Tax=Zizania palustris TaxID=103762 RepID=A0A8J5WL94_ZIZPA|nr:hypothetical protein GUJ93_ZPchr0011g26967 [Zizania palustris]
MAAEFSGVICKVLVMVVTMVALLFSAGVADGGPRYEYCLRKCIDRCDEYCRAMEYPHGGDCNMNGVCCCLS